MNDNRRKLTGILKLLYENTDAEHSLDTYQIMDALESMGYGRPDRKTIDSNIRFLIEDLGFGIRKEKGKPNRYRWVDREFDLGELKTLADAVNSARFISPRKSRELIAKLKDFTSVHCAASLVRDIHTSKYFKSEYNSVRDTMDVINDAFKASHKISFVQTDFDADKHLTELNDGRPLTVSPYALLYNNSHAYVLALPDGETEVQAYRMSFMKSVVELNQPVQAAPRSFDLSSYTEHIFDMLDGSMAEVTLSCKDHTMKDLVDRFGTDFLAEHITPGRFTAKVTTDVNRAFLAWVFSFGGDIKIMEPAHVRSQFDEMIKLQTYDHF